MPILNKDMQVCMSLAARPSNIGTRFHNFLYDELGLNFLYKAFTTTDLPGAVAGIRALGIRGCSVSMPFKEAIIPLVDHIEESAAAIQSVNTVVNDDGVLTASNTDYEAIAALLASHDVDTASRVLLRGSGGMAKAVTAAFRGAGFDRLTVVARNEQTGSALASQYGYEWVAEEREAGSPTWSSTSRPSACGATSRTRSPSRRAGSRRPTRSSTWSRSRRRPRWSVRGGMPASTSSPERRSSRCRRPASSSGTRASP